MNRAQTHPVRRRAGGFLVIEALVALLVLTTGVLGLATLYSHVTGSAADARSRSEAMAQAQSLLETWRNNVLQDQYEAQPAALTDPDTVVVDGITYRRTWSVTQAAAGLDNKRAEVTVAWTDRAGNAQQVQLNAILGWKDPTLGVVTQNRLQQLVPNPKGTALRKAGVYRPGDQVDPPRVDRNTNITQLMSADGVTPLLELNPKEDGTAQNFITINGRVYIDSSANNMPTSTDIYVRLSSEGLCVFDNRASALANYPATGTAAYKFFSYTCYVGPGWYGNIGVEIQQTNSPPTICVGDPAFTDTTFSATAASTEATFRSYRGFRASTTTNGNVTSTVYITTGMGSSSTIFTYGDDGTPNSTQALATAKAGMPRPSGYANPYSPPPSAANDYFRQDFLVTRVNGGASCRQKMQIAPGAFLYNAGQNFCISPDNSAQADQCPTAWPGQSAGNACGITVSGSFNPSLTGNPNTSLNCTTSTGASCSCSKSANTANYSCTTTGGTLPTMTITAVARKGRDTQTCVRTTAALACGLASSFNIPSSANSQGGASSCTPED